MPADNLEDVEEIIITPEKSEEILKELRQILLLSNLFVSKFVTIQWFEVNEKVTINSLGAAGNKNHKSGKNVAFKNNHSFTMQNILIFLC